MAHRDMYEARARPADAMDRDHRAASGARIIEYLGLLGLALVAILLVGLVANFLFGPSVSTSL